MGDECIRREFEDMVIADTKAPLRNGIMERCSTADGILRDYKDQGMELQWRGYKAGFISGNNHPHK